MLFPPDWQGAGIIRGQVHKSPNFFKTLSLKLGDLWTCPRIIPSSSYSRLSLHKFDIEAEALQLADQNVERLRNARLHCSFTFHNRLVDLGSSVHVVGLGCQQFLQNVCGAVCFESPHFHFSKSLSTELRFTAEWL